ncbi:GntR family transcriptional regulator [Agrobacterium tumefaciens]|uniref:GntR family transcriptional regulator n=1 Tax=Agrobacterium tumefaciens TaxID=358 RepID=UPI00287D737D|nr:GntR family transcriptional regulator [Agrobacterium tumefaciens]MDS7595603.1 GntR family transcriptional regulator [Agrobacterium tumefaciens]
MKNTGGSLPMYLQIAEMLVREVAAGRLIDGEKLAPERDMAAELGIAVGTLRKSLGELQERGLLERIQGSGNYIRAVSDPQSVYAFFRLELINGGGLPTAEILDVQRLPKPADLPAFGFSNEGHRIRRLRRISGKPAAIEEIWLDGSYVDAITLDNLSESLYLYYRTRLNLWISKAEDRIDIGETPEWTPDIFGQSAGSLTPRVLRLSQAQDGTVAEVSWTWFDHTIARYVSRMR